MAKMNEKISTLLREREAILKQLHRVNEALLHAAMQEVAHSPVAMPDLRGHAIRKAGRPAKAASKRRSWFERGEALTLIRKTATKPLAQADLVRHLAGAKGYTKSLDSDDLKRFHSAAYQAIANALARRQLTQSKDGTVVVKN